MDTDLSSGGSEDATREQAGSESGGFAFLRQRAIAFLETKGGAVHEDNLIAEVFGTAGTPALWRPLLRQVLGSDDDLSLRGDGFWALPAAGQVLDLAGMPEFVAVDVETTGLKPFQQRITEIALIRFRDGQAVDRFESLCNPERRIPHYIVSLTGITDSHVAEAPKFAELAASVTEFVGSSLIVGHNVGFDVSFINAELQRIGRPGLINERVDTLSLATTLIATLRKPSLDNVAKAVGLQPRKIHRAAADAELTGEVLHRLIAHAAATGKGDFAALRKQTVAAPRKPRDRVGRGRAVMDRSLLAAIPKAPGVYKMRDRFGNVIYVGKAKNLRDRVGSYYSQPLGYTRKMDGLLESMVSIDVEVVGSELQALLLESQLIKRYQPRYNTALRSFEQYPYIRVDVSNPWPRLTLTKQRKDDGARYFGPFRSTSSARKTVDVIGSVVPLRTCPRSFKNARSYGSPCLQLDLKRCVGPCVGRADRDAYAGMVRDVVQFLDGRDDALLDRIWAELEIASEKLDFERARKLRSDLHAVTSVVAAQRRLREASEKPNLLLVMPGAAAATREVALVVAGRIWAQRQVAVADVEGLAARLRESWERIPATGAPPVDHNVVDEANILLRWLAKNDGHPAILAIPTDDSALDWLDLSQRALAVSDEDLTKDVLPIEEDDGLADAGDDDESAANDMPSETEIAALEFA